MKKARVYYCPKKNKLRIFRFTGFNWKMVLSCGDGGIICGGYWCYIGEL